ncbi:MAG: N-acetylmuramoyl-L-alanine amidase [Massilibacteroides sp.]|nr:N-acetylmuramoyl-L-alanine amidase [Massilibacteroides sp.]
MVCPTIVARSSQKDFTVVIDAGHGGKDPGAHGYRAKEKDINLAVALKVGKLISSDKKVNVIYTRTKDYFVNLDERANIANRAKADLFISIHSNSIVHASNLHGVETYVLGLHRTKENLAVAQRENSVILLENDYKTKYEGFNPHSTESYIIFEFLQNKHLDLSINFASRIQKEGKKIRRIDRGVRQAGFLVLRETSMPAVLIELGYLSNRSEENYIRSSSGQKKLASAIYKAFVSYKKDFDNHTRSTTPTLSAKSSHANIKSRTKIAYRVQLLASVKKISLSSRELKGYKSIHIEKIGNYYTYTWGETTSYKKALQRRKSVLKHFKDAYLVVYRNGKRTK